MEHGELTRTSRPRPAVMADVAKLAGVSHQTVSRVVNGSDLVRPETRTRVEGAMRKLQYRPNPVARALATGRSKTVGVITFDTALYGPALTLLAIERAAHEAGFFVSITSLRALDAPSLTAAAESLLGQNAEAIFIIAPQRAVASAVLQLPTNVPIVAIEAGPADGVSVVAVDQAAGAAAATRHLLELGHETVWHIAGPEDWLEAGERVAGWKAALAEARAPIPPHLVGDWSARAGYELGAELAEMSDVTAVFVANDAMALGLLRRLHETGRTVPDSISVVGFDDTPEAAYLTPPLTTVRQDFMELGRRGFELAQRRLRGAHGVERISIAPELIVRQSTGPVKS